MPTPRKDDKLHDLHSTHPHDRTPITPATLVASRPRFPKGLTPEAKKVFKQLCRQLSDRRALTEGDGFLLQLFAETWDRRARAQSKLIEEGEITTYCRFDTNGKAHQVEKPNLNLKVVESTDKQLIAILDRLGLSPLAGSKIKQTRRTEVEDEALPGTVAYMILHPKEETKSDIRSRSEAN